MTASPSQRSAALRKLKKIVVLPLKPGGTVTSDVARVFTSLLLAEMDKIGNLSTVSKADLEAVLDVEKQKDMLGCDSSSCLAEIGGALGADLIMRGEIGQIGSSYEVDLNLVDAKNGLVVGRISHLLPKSDDALAHAAPQFATDLVEKLNR